MSGPCICGRACAWRRLGCVSIVTSLVAVAPAIAQPAPDPCAPAPRLVLAPEARYRAGMDPGALALEDLDGDQDLDVAVANRGSNDVSVLRNLGDGTFAPAASYRTRLAPASLAAGDLDGDGDLDLAVAGGETYLFRNEGGRSFRRLPGSFPADCITPVDFDGDGDVDLAGLSLTDPVYLLNLGAMQFGVAPNFPTRKNACLC